MALVAARAGPEPASAGPEPAGLEQLPPELLTRVLAGDQSGRVMCMLSSRGLYRALHTPAVWTTVHFDRLEPRALDFLRFARECRCLSLATESADDALWFLDAAADTCPALGGCLSSLSLRVTERAERIPADLPAALTRFPALETLSVSLAPVDVCAVEFPAAPAARGGCARLRSLTWDEAPADDGGRGVRLGVAGLARYAGRLADIVVAARACDVLDARFPGARRVAYASTDETYERADLADLDLDELRLHVHAVSDRWRLAAELSRASRIAVLALVVDDDLQLLRRLPVEELVLDTDSLGVSVDVDYDVVARWLPRVRVSCAADGGGHPPPMTVNFLGMDVSRLREFSAWAEGALDAASSVTVVLDRRLA